MKRAYVPAKWMSVLAALLILCAYASMFSQSANGRILGSVKDQTGAVIGGATITILDVQRGTQRTLTTDESGAYFAPNVIPGTYTLRVEFAGFRQFERQNIGVEVSKDVVVDVVLEPGSQNEKITVTEEIPLIETANSTLGGTLSNATIVDLPISGRNYQNLLELRPGVVLTLGNDSNGGGPASTNGLRAESSNTYTIEGLHGMDPYTGQSVVNNIGVNGDAASLLPVDAIQEFNQQFNPKAAYGWKAGSAVSVGLKSGTNTLHGTAYGFFRNQALDARNYFTPAGINIDQNTRQVGGTLGGRLKKDKMFFFLGYEQMNLNVGNPTSIQAPFTDPGMLSCTGTGAAFTCTPKAGLFPFQGVNKVPDASNHFMLACLALPKASRSPQSLAMLSLDADCQPQQNYPNPNFFVPHGALDHGAQAPNNTSITQFFANNDTEVLALGSLAKIDYQLNEKNTLNGFFYKGFGERFDGLGAQPSNRYRTDFLQYPIMGAGTWTWLPNSGIVNSLRIGYSRLNQPNYSMDGLLGLSAAQMGLNTGVTDPQEYGLPQAITLTGFYSIGGREHDFQGPGRAIEITDQVSWLRGRHALMFGGTAIFDRFEGAINAQGKGSFVFGRAAPTGGQPSGVVGFLAGQNAVPATVGSAALGGVINLTATTAAQGGGLDSAQRLYNNPFSVLKRQNWAFFIQDDWRVNSRLTFNLGLRYGFSTVLKTDPKVLSRFDPTIAGGLPQEGVQIPKLYGGDHNNFEPRIGFAWDVRGNGSTVIRAGGSLIYELLSLRGFFEVGNALGLAGNPTNWIIGCSSPVTPTIPAGATSNCPGSLVTPGGNRNVGNVAWSRAQGNIVGNVLWDRTSPDSTPIFPTATLLNCNPSILTRDSANGVPRAGALCSVGSLDPHLVTPYVETWTFSIQQAIRPNVVLDLSYVGNHGVKLLDKVNLNQPLPGSSTINGVPMNSPAAQANCNSLQTQAACGNNVTIGTRPYSAQFPWLGDVTHMVNADTSNYNGLQATVTARNYHGVSLVSGYTWAHGLSFSDNNNGGFGIDAYNRAFDYGASASDLRHRFTLAPSYSLPGPKSAGGILSGWKLNANFKYQTGRPITATNTTDFQGTGRGTSRWDFFGNASDFKTNYSADNGLVRNPNLPQFYPGCPVDAVADPGCANIASLNAGGATNPRTGLPYVAGDMAVNQPLCKSNSRSIATLRAFGCWVDGNSSLTPPPLGGFGYFPKGLFRGPTFWDLAMSLTKRQNITENVSVEFRGELFNILNHPSFNNPVAGNLGLQNGCTSTSCNFYRITNTPDVQATNPVLGQGGPRRVQLGVKLLF